MTFDKLNYGPLDWFITIDGIVHTVEGEKRISTAKKTLRERLGRPIPRNAGYSSQRKGGVGFYSAGRQGTHDHQVRWYAW